MKDLIYSNVALKPEVYYFLYIGEFKSYGINLFMKEFLERKLSRRVEIIAIIPDIFEQYPFQNIVVINPVAAHLDKVHRTCVRVDGEVFAKAVSESRYVKDLIEKLLKQQGELYIYMYESSVSLTLTEIPSVKLIGPDARLVKRFNHKLFQHEEFSKVVPMVEFRICNSLSELIRVSESLRERFKDGIFVSAPYSAAGINSAITHSTQDILKKFKEENQQYLMSKFTPHKYDPTVLAVAINEEEIYIAGVANQRIEEGNKFTGSTYPSGMDRQVIENLKEYTRKIGKRIAKEGYRGIFGCDFIVTENNEAYFIELNARKQGTTMEFCCMLENVLPKGSPNLPEIEFYAVTESRLAEKAIEPECTTDVKWTTYNFKMKEDARTGGYIPHYRYEREMFRLIYSNELQKSYCILEHVGSNMHVKAGGFLGRIVSISRDEKDLESGIEIGKRILQATIT